MKCQKLLVATDLSAESQHTLEYAVHRILEGSETIYLATAVDLSPYTGYTDPFMLPPPEKEMVECATQQQVIVREAYFKNFSVTCMVQATYNAAQWIVDQAKSHKCDAILVGSHGAGALANLFLGSTAQRVIKLSDRPVIVVPKQA